MLPHPDQALLARVWSRRDIPDSLWPTDNDAGVPTLRLDRCADAVDLPVVMWGTRARSRRMFGTWGFYVDDYRFNALWADPSPILNSGCVNIIEPNFTIHDQLPNAVALYHTYRKRYLARTWQELGGIRVFVDLNVPPTHAAMNLLGVPAGWRAYATRGYADRLHQLEGEVARAIEHRGSDDILFLVYGGGAKVRDYCLARGLIWVPEQQDVAQRRALAASVGPLGLAAPASTPLALPMPEEAAHAG